MRLLLPVGLTLTGVTALVLTAHRVARKTEHWERHPAAPTAPSGAALEFQEIKDRHHQVVSALIGARTHISPTTLHLGLAASQARATVRDPDTATPEDIHAYGLAVLSLEENVRDLLFDPDREVDTFQDAIPVSLLQTAPPRRPRPPL